MRKALESSITTSVPVSEWQRKGQQMGAGVSFFLAWVDPIPLYTRDLPNVYVTQDVRQYEFDKRLARAAFFI